MELGIQGKVVLVTGGSYGIGRAIALAFARERCRVAICARGKERLDTALRAIEDAGAEGLAIQADVLQPEDISRVVDAVVKKWGRIDILINNVGGGGGRVPGPVEAVPEEKWIDTFELNTLAAVRFSMRVLPHMRRNRWGRIVTISSLQGREGGGRPWYTMAKSAEIGFMKTLALNHELARDGITFNTIAPGRVIFEGNEWDDFRREDAARFDRAIRDGVPVERAGTPEDVAAVVAFICSTHTGYLNGACIPVDGGESRSF